MISGEAKAIPNRIPAAPHALDMVCRTIRFGNLSNSPKKEGSMEKST